MSLQFKAHLESQDHTSTHTHDRLKTKWYAHMWIRACVHVCVVCVRGQLYVCGQPPSQLREQAGDSWAVGGGGEGGGGGLVLHGRPRFQLNQGLTLIPFPHTNTH